MKLSIIGLCLAGVLLGVAFERSGPKSQERWNRIEGGANWLNGSLSRQSKLNGWLLTGPRSSRLRALDGALGELSIATIHEMFHILMGKPRKDWHMIKLLLLELIARDAKGGLEFTMRHGDNTLVLWALREVLKTEPEVALEAGEIAGDRGHVYKGLRPYLDDWFSADDLMRDIHQHNGESHPLTELYMLFAARDLQAAERKYRMLKDKIDKLAAIKGIVAALTSDGDITAAREWLARELNQDLRWEATRHLVGELAKSDPLKASELATELPLSFESYPVYARVTRELMARDPRQGIRWFEKTVPPGELRDAIIADLANDMSSAAPKDVVKGLFETDLFGREPLLEGALGRWVSENESEPLEWARTLDEDDATVVEQIALETIAKEDAERAFELAATLDTPDAVAAILHGAIAADPAEAWVRYGSELDLLPQEQALMMKKELFEEWAADDAQGAMDALISSVAWETDNSANYGATAASITRKWIEQAGNAESFIAWMENMPERIPADSIFSALADTMAPYEPASGIHYAGRIADERMQWNRIQNVLAEMPVELDVKKIVREARISPSLEEKILNQYEK